jgi:hypothetical protein
MELSALSWMLLISDVASKTGEYLTILGLVSLAVCGGIVMATSESFQHEDRVSKKILLIPLILFVLALPLSLVPSKTAILQVAVVELGEDTLKMLMNEHFPEGGLKT